MTPEQWKQVKLLFQRVVELEPSQYEIYLNENCTNEDVRRELDSLLANHQKADQFLAPLNPQVLKPAEATKLGVETITESENFFDSMIGKKLNNTYRIEEKIGEGGMGAVFRCTHMLLGNQVAIKVMSADIKKNNDYVKRFRREARVGWVLSHPNIIKVLEFSQSEEGLFFIVMEYFKSQTLKNYIKELAPVSLSKAIKILEPICDALDVTHKRNILHRDLKPANILISQQGDETVKLADFGILKLLQPDEQISMEAAALTNEAIIGTINYMSPEQLMNYNLSPASDIYSLGVIFHEMITGQLPVQAKSLYIPEVLKLKTGYSKLPSASTQFPFLPPSIDKVMSKALTASPSQRYPNVTEFMKALKSVEPSL